MIKEIIDHSNISIKINNNTKPTSRQIVIILIEILLNSLIITIIIQIQQTITTTINFTAIFKVKIMETITIIIIAIKRTIIMLLNHK